MASRKTIAVCFSGQPRLWKTALPSIQNFFCSASHDYIFFGHAWDENSWKTLIDNERDYINERLDREALNEELKAALPFAGLIVDPQLKPDGTDDWKTWTPMIRSVAISNHLKTRYEIEHNMVFDIVVRTRWDLVYHPARKFDFHINDYFNPNVLYCNLMNDFHREFRLPAIDDVMYFGTSRVMNIMSNMYLPYANNGLGKRWRADDFNVAHFFVGGGVLLHKWATLHNIGLLQPPDFITPIVLRKGADKFKWPEEYDQMAKTFLDFTPV